MSSDRALSLSKVDLILPETTPLQILDSFCKQGLYIPTFSWDRFNNGFMMSCDVSFTLHRKKKILTREVQWVATDDVDHAKNVVSAVLLTKLGFEITEEQTPEDIFNELTHSGMEAMKGIVKNLGKWGDQ